MNQKPAPAYWSLMPEEWNERWELLLSLKPFHVLWMVSGTNKNQKKITLIGKKGDVQPRRTSIPLLLFLGSRKEWKLILTLSTSLNNWHKNLLKWNNLTDPLLDFRRVSLMVRTTWSLWWCFRSSVVPASSPSHKQMHRKWCTGFMPGSPNLIWPPLISAEIKGSSFS